VDTLFMVDQWNCDCMAPLTSTLTSFTPINFTTNMWLNYLSPYIWEPNRMLK
jgi:hypothetical protein